MNANYYLIYDFDFLNHGQLIQMQGDLKDNDLDPINNIINITHLEYFNNFYQKVVVLTQNNYHNFHEFNQTNGLTILREYLENINSIFFAVLFLLLKIISNMEKAFTKLPYNIYFMISFTTQVFTQNIKKSLSCHKSFVNKANHNFQQIARL